PDAPRSSKQTRIGDAAQRQGRAQRDLGKQDISLTGDEPMNCCGQATLANRRGNLERLQNHQVKLPALEFRNFRYHGPNSMYAHNSMRAFLHVDNSVPPPGWPNLATPANPRMSVPVRWSTSGHKAVRNPEFVDS